MVLVIVGGLATASLLLFEGVHLLITGSLPRFFERPATSSRSRSSLGFGHRIAGSVLLIIPAIATFWILTVASLRGDMHRTLEWLSDHGVGLFGGLFLFVY